MGIYTPAIGVFMTIPTGEKKQPCFKPGAKKKTAGPGHVLVFRLDGRSDIRLLIPLHGSLHPHHHAHHSLGGRNLPGTRVWDPQIQTWEADRYDGFQKEIAWNMIIIMVFFANSGGFF